MLSATPKPPYYAVIFTSLRTPGDAGYESMSNKMISLAQTQPGFLGMESAREEKALGITVSYWKDLESISNWKKNTEHQEAQKLGKDNWYEHFKVRICKVEREYKF
jgi:heme-degrading monooxygenase HmoA